MQISKPWDKAALIAGLKDQGLPIAEEAAEKLVETIVEWTEQSVSMSGGIAAMVVMPLLAAAKPEIKKALDKIDGEPG